MLLSRYGRLGASSRIRSLQYLPHISNDGIHVDVEPLFSDAYLKALYTGGARGWKVLVGYFYRLKVLSSIKKYDLIWLEKEVFPFFPAGMERLLSILGVPFLVDYDDALFHRYDLHRSWFIRTLLGKKIDAVMRRAAVVTVGNEYLAERARSAGAQRVEIVPTVVDLARYNSVPSDSNHSLIVGWIGSPATERYLSGIAPTLKALAGDYDVRLVAVGASKGGTKGLPIEVWPWTEETEAQSIQAFDIGIMPLVDSPWEQGKCGYKLIQYMACGLPVVASPVGVNTQIVEHGVNGFLAQNQHEWEKALRRLLNDRDLRRSMGQKGRKKVEDRYSLQVQAPRLENLLLKMSRNAGCAV